MITSSTPLRILLVEDQPIDAELVIAGLERSGVVFSPVTTVASRAAFIEELAHVPDLILCDFSLPSFDAMEALRIVKEHKLLIPFIIISGSIGEETAVEAIKAGADDYLLKDRMARLGPAISHAIEEKRLRAAAERAEENLRQSEYKYRCLFDHLLDAAFLCDSTTGRIIDTNQRGLSLLNMERAAVLGARLSRFIPANSWRTLQEFAAAESSDVSESESTINASSTPDLAVRMSATIVTIHQRRLLFVFIRARQIAS
jgi:CheY-like chemotaxis protein